MSLCSPIPKIDILHCSKLPAGRGVKCQRFAVQDNMVVIILEDGRVWTNWPQFQKFCLTGGTWQGRVDRFLRCLVALKFIKRSEMDKHVAWAKDAEKRHALHLDQLSINKLAERYGFKAPKLKQAK